MSPRAGQVKPPDDDRLSDRVALGVLTRLVPRELVDEVLVETGRQERRVRLLPARMVVYYVMALALFFGDGYEEVMRRLVGSLRQMGAWRQGWVVPSTAALTKARARLGPEPLKVLFERVAVPMAPAELANGWCAGRRVMAVDGTNVDLADTAANVTEFGYPSGGGAFPQVRVVALAETGTHAVTAVATGRARAGERKLFLELLPHLGPDILVLADRGFLSYELWGQMIATGVDLCWRAKSSTDLPVLEALPDGSYLSRLSDPVMANKRRDQVRKHVRNLVEVPGHRVRVIEYQVVDRGGAEAEPETYRLVTTLLDPDEVPATELCSLYHRRWELESTFNEIKTSQRGAGIVLRSKSLPMVYQELYALLLTHYAIRELMVHATESDGGEAELERLSFVRSLRLVRRHVTGQAAFSP
ncbi:MAG TPA: IS4 family transposase [Dermatophilaceae bacterium]|nr:IS4 family transposase [Dermatophilaceae bacterium]